MIDCTRHVVQKQDILLIQDIYVTVEIGQDEAQTKLYN